MSDAPPDLRRTQRWMQAVITHPGGIVAGIASEEARQHLDLAVEDVEQAVTRSQALTPTERLGIYGRAYHARLLECFHAEYPTLRYALGEDLLNRFVLGYLEQYPPQRYTLHRLAEHFPRYLAETRPDADASPERREQWPDFIIDLATLERAFIETYDGPGTEGQKILRADDVSESAEDALRAARLTPAPCLRLLAFRYPVAAYFHAVRSGQEPERPPPARTYLALTRRDFQVYFHDLAAPHYEILSALATQQPVGAAFAQPDFAMPFDEARRLLRQWAANGFFAGITSDVR